MRGQNRHVGIELDEIRVLLVVSKVEVVRVPAGVSVLERSRALRPSLLT